MVHEEVALNQLIATRRSMQKEAERCKGAGHEKTLDGVWVLFIARALKLDGLMENEKKRKPAASKGMQAEKKIKIERGPAKIKYLYLVACGAILDRPQPSAEMGDGAAGRGLAAQMVCGLLI